MEITQTRKPFDGFDQFKITGTTDIGDSLCNARVTISATGARKSEAIEKAIKQIDVLISVLEKSKAQFGEI